MDHLKLARVVGLIVAAVGLAIGLWSIHVPALNGVENCGSPFQASDYETNGTGSLIVGECDSERQSRLLWAVVLLGGGLVGAGVAHYVLSPSGFVVGRSAKEEPVEPEVESTV